MFGNEIFVATQLKLERARIFSTGAIFGVFICIFATLLYSIFLPDAKDRDDFVRPPATLNAKTKAAPELPQTVFDHSSRRARQEKGWLRDFVSQDVILCVQASKLETAHLAQADPRLELSCEIPTDLVERVRQVAIYVGKQQLPQGEYVESTAELIQAASHQVPRPDQLGWESSRSERTLILQIDEPSNDAFTSERTESVLRVNVPDHLVGNVDMVAVRVGKELLPRNDF